MRRTVRVGSVVRFGAMAAAGLLTMTACSTMQLGAAAVTDSGRITTSQLANEVANLNAGYQALPDKSQVGYPPSAMPREVLSWLLRFQVVNRLAAREGIHVTATQAAIAKNAVRASVAQQGTTLQVAAVRNGLPPDLLDQLGQYVAIQNELQTKLDGGHAPTSNAAAQALTMEFDHLQCLAAKSLHIQVNPQYGQMDYASYAVVPVTSTLAAAGSALPTKKTTALTNPPC